MQVAFSNNKENFEQKIIIENMVKSIVLDRKLKFIEMEKENDNKYFFGRPNLIHLRDRENLTQINEELHNSFVEMLK